jgi:hypothetical protein
MIFANEKARRQLLEKGVVYTFRVHRHTEGRDWATDRRRGKKICDINVEFIKKVDFKEELMPYVDESGFEHRWDWLSAIRRLNPKMKKIEAYLYKVTKL